MTQHYIKRCSCGAVISQCRCLGVKNEIIVPDGCAACRRAPNPNPNPNPNPGTSTT